MIPLSMRAKQLLLACGIALGTAVLIGGYNYVWVKRLTLDRAITGLTNSAELIAPQIQDGYERMRHDVVALSLMPPFQGLVRSMGNAGTDRLDGSTTAQWRSRLETIFASMMTHRPEYVQMRFIGIANDGLELVRTDRKDGAIINRPIEDLQRKAAEPYFRDSLGVPRGGIHFSAVTPNRDEGRIQFELPVLRVTTPIFQDDGTLFGFAVINAHYGEMLKGALSQIGAKEELYVVNDTGDYVRRSAGGMISDVVLHDRGNPIPPVIAAVEAMEEDQGAILSQNIDGQDMIVSKASVEFDENSSGRFVTVILAASRAAVLAEANKTQAQVLWLTGLLLACVLLLAFLTSEKLTRPLRLAVKSIQAYEPGKSDLRLPTERQDEIGELSRAFSGLVARLEQARSDQSSMLGRLEAILDNTIDGVINFDQQGTIESFNSGAAGIFGYRPEEAIGQNVDLLLPDRRSKGNRRPQAQMRERLPKPGVSWLVGRVCELEARTKEGRIIPVEISVSEVNLASGKHYSGIVRDITGRKRLEAEVQRRAAELNRSNRDLTSARDEAQAANQAKSEFLATMSHEIRTPMNGIIGMTDLLLEGDLDASQRNLGKTVLTSAEALLEIINQILDFSRIESGAVELEPVAFDLKAAVEDVNEVLAVKAQERQLDLILLFRPDTPRFLVGDVGRVRQILFNLVGNAIKFTEKGSVRITVGSEGSQPTSEDEVRIRVNVEDSGIGLPEDRLETIFERFAQADTSTTRRFGGTGLGLSICKHLVTLMGGEIGAENRAEGGSSFWFTMQLSLDRRAPSLETARPERQSQDVAKGADAVFDAVSVLLVEDNFVNQEFMTAMLGLLGCDVTLAKDGQEAIDRVALQSFDIIFMDCQMPVMDGFEASEAICRMFTENRIPRIPIVALTANVMKGDRERCLEAGMDDFLSKPVRKKELIGAVQRWVVEGSAAEATPGPVGAGRKAG